jgi:hypothetical protein
MPPVNLKRVQQSNSTFDRGVFALIDILADFPPRRPVFDSRLGRVGFVVDRVELGRVFSKSFGFSCQFSFHHLLHIKKL